MKVFKVDYFFEVIIFQAISQTISEKASATENASVVKVSNYDIESFFQV